MSIEFGAICPSPPQVEVIGRASGLWLSAVLGSPAPVTTEIRGEGVTFHLGSAASAFTTVHGPGEHEYADSWLTICGPESREPLAWLLAVVAAATTAELYGGRFIDDARLLSVGRSARELLVGAVQCESSSAAHILADMGHPFNG